MSSNRSARRGQDGPRRRTPGKKKSRHNDVRVLAVLLDLAPLKLRQIVDHAHIPYQVAHRTLTALHAQDHVTRSEDGTRGKDHRDGHAYELTASGRLYCAALGVAPGT